MIAAKLNVATFGCLCISLTYPHSMASRIRPYRNFFVACQRVGTATGSQIRTFVGRSTQATAASSSDRRSLYKDEPKFRVELG